MDRRTFLALMSSSVAAAKQATASPLKALRGAKDASFVPRRSSRPLNVVLMICDDIGFGDLGCYGSKLPTPNLDRMAAQGMRFTRFNGGHPLCSASRASLLSGRYGTRMNTAGAFGPRAKTATSLDETLLPQLFKAKNYATKAVGKWHLGDAVPYMPTSRGFDSYFGLNWSVDMEPAELMRDTTVIEEHTDRAILTPRYVKEAVPFIEKAGDKPFFLYLGFPYPHDPPKASEKFRGKSGFGDQGDAIAEIDWAVGELMAALERKGLTKDTLVLFTGDHGPWYQGDPGHLRGRKASTFEGGFRVPLLAKLPGVIHEGVVCETPCCNMDILPSLATMCGLGLPEKPLDGVDISALFTGSDKPIEERAQVYFSAMSKRGLQPHCIRKGDWKLRVAQAFDGEAYINDRSTGANRSAWLANAELYNVGTDPGENYNVANNHPERVTALRDELEVIMKTFPDDVQAEYAELKQLVGNASTPAAAVPRMGSQQFSDRCHT
jgi:arylsulfatase A